MLSLGGGADELRSAARAGAGAASGGVSIDSSGFLGEKAIRSDLTAVS